ncbi:MAG: tripartite tricarboxylate transporter permease [Bilophila wadsworthia]
MRASEAHQFPTAILLSIIVICSLLGVYLPRSNMFDVWMALLIGVIAFRCALRISHGPVPHRLAASA